MKKKLLMFGLGGMTLLFSACGDSSEENLDQIITSDQKKSIESKRGELRKVYDALPDSGSEAEVDYSGKVLNNIHTIGDEYLLNIIQGGKNSQDLLANGAGWLSSGHWHIFDPFYLEQYSNAPEYVESHIESITSMQQFCVFRIESFDPGEMDGDIIVSPATFTGWMWLFDLKNSKLLGCKKMEVESSDLFYTFNSDISEGLVEDLGYNILQSSEKILNQWAGTQDKSYLSRNQ